MEHIKTQFTDRAPVIFDIGSRLTKIGFAGDLAPREVLFTSVPKCPNKPLFDAKLSDADNDENVRQFFHNIYYSHLLVMPKERRVVVCESVVCPTKERQCIARVLFDQFDVPSILFAPVHLVAAMPFKARNALVADVGHRETLVLPIFDNVPMLNCWEASPSAGQLLQCRVKELLMKHASLTSNDGKTIPVNDKPELLTQSLCEDVLVRTCFVTHLQRGKAYQAAEIDENLKKDLPKPPPDVQIPLINSEYTLIVPGIVRESACECIFSKDDDRKPLPMLILDSVLRCPIDIRRMLLSRLLIVGGLAEMNGFMARLKAELNTLLQTDYASRLPAAELKFLMLKGTAKQTYLAWLGGSLFGSTEILAYRSYSKEDWISNGKRVPDWTDKVCEPNRDMMMNILIRRDDCYCRITSTMHPIVIGRM